MSRFVTRDGDECPNGCADTTFPCSTCGHGSTDPPRGAWSQAAFDEAVAAVLVERVRQHERWGDQSAHPPATWLAILTEEIGEAAQALLHDEFGGDHAGTLRDELVQVAAVAVAWIGVLDRQAAGS